MVKFLKIIKTVFFEIQLRFLSESQELVIVTGSDSSHFKSLVQLLKSLSIHEFNTKTIVYNLGMLEHEIKTIHNKFPNIELRKFDYSKYPEYFNIKINAGEYAWKPVIISDVLNEFKCSICWLDGGNIVTKPLVQLRKIIEHFGFYSPYSKGKIKDWTHPRTLECLSISKQDKILTQTNLNGACVSANYNNVAVRSVIDLWKNCALTKECIAPDGSSRENHRQDQAVLSVLAYKEISHIAKKMTFKRFGFKTHQDID